ncbi:hypothetical protein ACFFRR_008244 [Megaselia abdita]
MKYRLTFLLLCLVLFQLCSAQFFQRGFGQGPFVNRNRFGGGGFRGGPFSGRQGPFTNVNPGQSQSFANADSRTRSLTLITPFGPFGLVGSRSNANSGAVASGR